MLIGNNSVAAGWKMASAFYQLSCALLAGEMDVNPKRSFGKEFWAALDECKRLFVAGRIILLNDGNLS